MPIINKKSSIQDSRASELPANKVVGDLTTIAHLGDMSRQGKSPRRRAGGRSGNKNALKHGLYARHFTPDERLAMGNMPPLEALQEIHLLRLTLDRILTLIESCQDEDRKVKLYNSLYLGAQRLITAMRTQTILAGEDKELLTAFWDAMALFRREHNI